MSTLIVVGGNKGVVGKSTTAALMATSRKFLMLGNYWWSPIEQYLNKERNIYKKLSKDQAIPDLSRVNVVVDAGGWEDDRLVPVIQQCGVLLVPTTISLIDLDTMKEFLKKTIKITPNIVIVLNKFKKGQREDLTMYLESIADYEFHKLPIVELSESKLFDRCLNNGMSIKQQEEQSISSLWFKHVFRAPLAQFAELNKVVDQYVTSKAAA